MIRIRCNRLIPAIPVKWRSGQRHRKLPWLAQIRSSGQKNGTQGDEKSGELQKQNATFASQNTLCTQKIKPTLE
jgi:hypothetical protein